MKMLSNQNVATCRRSLVLMVIGASLICIGPAAHGAIVLSGGLTLVGEGPPAAAAGGAAPLSLASGGTAFALDELGGTHVIANVNNGTYGNSSSWIGGGGASGDGPFIGISLGAATTQVQSIAFGRSNVLSGDPCIGGVCTDRTLGLYTLQFTAVANPDETTPDTSWTDIGTLNYISAGGDPNFLAPHQRHVYNFNPVNATGLRLIVPATGGGGTAIDEIELYSSAFGTALAAGSSVIQDETTNSTGLGFGGPAIAEPDPGNDAYLHANGPGQFFWSPGIFAENVTVDVSWGVSFNHSVDVDYFFDPDGSGPMAEIALTQDINQTLFADQLNNLPSGQAWSGFFEIGSGLDLNPGSFFRVTGTAAGGVFPEALSSAVWRFTAAPVPEPSTLILGVFGIVALASFRRRKR